MRLRGRDLLALSSALLGVALLVGANRWRATLDSVPAVDAPIPGAAWLGELAPFQRPVTGTLTQVFALSEGHEIVTRDPFRTSVVAPTPTRVIASAPALAEDADVPAPRANQLETLQLSAILIADGRRAAVVNETIVAVGDPIGGGRVSAIERDHVIVSAPDGRRRVLSILDRGS